MPETINWSFAVEAVQGPRISGSDALKVDAYDKISVVLAADLATNPTKVDVQVQPADADGKVHLLVIRASAYDTEIKFSVDESNEAPFDLDGPVVLIGTGAVSLLAKAPQTLHFSNGTSSDVTVDILVGRNFIT